MTFSLPARLYSRTTGPPFSSRPSVSMRPPWVVLNSTTWNEFLHDIVAYCGNARNEGNVQCPQTKASRAYFGRHAMPIYISRGRFTTDAVKGMLAKPENREEAVANLFKSVGGKLIGWYLTFGHHDWLAIGEFPNEKAAASAVLAAAAGGSLSDIETTVARTAKDAHATFVSAGKAAKGFRSAGGS